MITPVGQVSEVVLISNSIKREHGIFICQRGAQVEMGGKALTWMMTDQVRKEMVKM